jgi:hypothetical protein
VQQLYNFPHTSSSDVTACKDVAGIISNFLGTAGRKGLKQADGSAEMLVLVSVGHHDHPARNPPKPSLRSLCVESCVQVLEETQRLNLAYMCLIAINITSHG